MTESVNYKCLACDAPLQFSPETGMLTCEFCGSSFTVAQVEQAMAEKQAQADQKAQREEKRAQAQRAEEARTAAAGAAEEAAPDGSAQPREDVHATPSNADPIAAFLERAPWESASEENVMSYVCSSCSAELLVDKTYVISECPYCGNQAVVPGKISGVMKPDYVIPFKVDKQFAIDALNKHYQGKPYLPDSFTDQNHLEHVQGVYVPFWLYSYTTNGSATYEASNSHTWVDGRGDTMQETTVYRAYRVGNMKFDRIPADGSSKMPDAHMDAIEPFDYSELKPFSVAYLPGFAAERYDQSPDDVVERALGRMKTSISTALRETVTGYDSVTEESCDSSETLDSVSYALLPVWMLHTKWEGKDFLFAMNGQTGKFIGDLPIDNGKVRKTILKFAIPLAAVLGAVGGYLSWM